MAEAALFYETASAGLGDDFLDDVQRAIDQARESPSLGVVFAGKFRRLLLRRFPFGLIYAIEPDMIVVAAVAHQRRRPSY